MYAGVQLGGGSWGQGRFRSLRRGALCAPASGISCGWYGGRRTPHPSRLAPRHLPPTGGRLWGRLEAAPAGCLRSLRRGAHRAPAGLPPAAPILPGQARSPRGVCPPIQHTRGGSTNGGIGCGPPPAPDAGAMPKGPRLPYRGAGGKRTAGLRRNACGAVVPPGASPGGALPPGAK